MRKTVQTSRQETKRASKVAGQGAGRRATAEPSRPRDNRSKAKPPGVNKLGEKSRNAEDNPSFLGNNRDHGRFRLRAAASSVEIGQRPSRRSAGRFLWHINLSSMRSSWRRALSVCPARWQGDVEPEAQSGGAGSRDLSFGVGWRPSDGGSSASASTRARQDKRKTRRGGEPSISVERRPYDKPSAFRRLGQRQHRHGADQFAGTSAGRSTCEFARTRGAAGCFNRRRTVRQRRAEDGAGGAGSRHYLAACERALAGAAGPNGLAIVGKYAPCTR
jgi:hypothetical protein